jgi:ankyrin repeat protein
MLASLKGNLEMVKFLVSEGADVNMVNNNGGTALMAASEKGNLEIVKFLVSKGADVNAVNNNGNTALMLASENGNLEMVKFLFSEGADVNAVNNIGNTALMNASMFGRLKVVQFLVSKGADVNMVNNNGRSALTITPDIHIIRFLGKVSRQGYLQDFQRVARTAHQTASSRQAQLEKYTPLPGDVARRIANMSLNSFGKKKRMGGGVLDSEISYLHSL